MKIQIVSYDKTNLLNSFNATVSSFKEPKSLDMFDINIFSLQNENLWRYEKTSNTTLNYSKDFDSIRQMILLSSKSICLIALPQNYMHMWSFCSNEYISKALLKDEIFNLCNNLLKSIIPETYLSKVDLIYENSVTKIKDKTFNSAFCFIVNENVLTKSVGGDKPTTIRFGNLILTTLDLSSPNTTIDDFISGIGLTEQKSELPQWLIDYKCFDDVEQQKLICESIAEIEKLNNKIEQANLKLRENIKYKSILSTNGDELVSVVFEILEKILDCNLSDFKDNKKEDFLLKKESVSFIGEIKGITSNVKSENVAQVERHYQAYMDELQEKGQNENVKQLLIINPFRTKEISMREEVHQIQIDLAKRYGSLIITTNTLLKIFEMFEKKEVTTEKIISVFSTAVGLADINLFK